MTRLLFARATRLLLPGVLALAPAASTQDIDAAARNRLAYDYKPGVVLVWASIKADITLNGPAAGTKTGLTMLQDPVYMRMHAEFSSGGSGFLVTPDGYMVTNGHVVQMFQESNEDKLQIQLFHDALDALGFFDLQAVRRYAGPEEGELPKLTADKRMALVTRLLEYATITLDKELTVYLQNWQSFPAEVKQYSPPIQPFTGRFSIPGKTWATGKDVAVLKIEGRDLPTLKIGDSDRMTLGDNVYVFGYPGLASFNDFLKPNAPIQATFNRGQISSLKVDVKGSRLLQSDASISFGNSGGPMLNERGEVVGMPTMTTEERQGFGYAVPTSVINEFIRAAGVTPAQGTFDRTWKETLDSYYQASAASSSSEKLALFTKSISGFDQALRWLPNLTDAMDLRREAMARADELRVQGVSTSSPTRWIVGGVAVVALVLIGLAVVMRQRSGAGSGAVIKARVTNGDGQYRLVVRAGPLQGNSFALVPKGVRIGRDPATCQVVLSEETVSREHALIAKSGANSDVVVKNLSGTNRTFVNDRPIQETVLHPGDTIKIGNSVISFEQI